MYVYLYLNSIFLYFVQCAFFSVVAKFFAVGYGLLLIAAVFIFLL